MLAQVFKTHTSEMITVFAPTVRVQMYLALNRHWAKILSMSVMQTLMVNGSRVFRCNRQTKIDQYSDCKVPPLI
jgi:hypothetical protein